MRLTATVGPRSPRTRIHWPMIPRGFQDSRGMRDVWAGIDCMPMSAGSIHQAGVRRVQFAVAELASVRSRHAATVSAMLDGLQRRRLTEHEAILRRSDNVNAIRFDWRSVCQRDD